MPNSEIVAEATSGEESEVPCGAALSFGYASTPNGTIF